jgi:hypothetical protein
VSPFLALAAATSGRLTRRCSPYRDPELAGGYLPPVACWQGQDTACRAYIQTGTELFVDAKHRLVIVYGVSDSCFATIAEEAARAGDGRKIYGWREKHGKLSNIGGGILVISEMSEKVVKEYQALTYYKDREGP